MITQEKKRCEDGVFFTNMMERLDSLVERIPQRTAYTFEGEDGTEANVTYRQLRQSACAIAAKLQTTTNQGDRVLLLYPPGLDFIKAFFGCMYAGVVAVPTCYPKPSRSMPRLSYIALDAQASVVLTTQQTLEQLSFGPDDGDLSRLPQHVTDTLDASLECTWERPDLGHDDVALLQYTSGSTSEPKGVIVSHGNLLHNLEAIRRAFSVDAVGDHDDEDQVQIGVFWLPAYHDMGLIGGILTPMYMGGHSYLMSPRSFLQRPLRWLRAIDRCRGTISGAPNFAYDLCVDKTTPLQRRTLDLSQWRLAFCGAEPIRAKTLERFADAFADAGFRRDSFYPCYGLAESTLLASGGAGPGAPVVKSVQRDSLLSNRASTANGHEAESIQQLVACGDAVFGQEIVIVDPDKNVACSPGHVGEIWVKGPSNARGYWNRPRETERTFHAHLADSGDGPYLRTGDLGFTEEGNLYVTGRLKDVVILRGRNHYPQDIELTVGEAHEALRSKAGAAFAVEVNDEERLVVVQEVDRHYRDPDWSEVVSRIRQAIVREHEVDPYSIVLLRQASLPRTTSGKVQRRKCRRRFLKAQFKVIHQWINEAARRIPRHRPAETPAVPTPPSPLAIRTPMSTGEIDRLSERIEAWVMDWLKQRTGIPLDQVHRDKPFAEYGLDSLTAVEMSQQLKDWLHIELTAVVAWNYPTPAKLAPYLAAQAAGVSTEEPQQVEVSQRAATVGEFEQLLSEIESLSEDDAETALLQKRSNV